MRGIYCGRSIIMNIPPTFTFSTLMPWNYPGFYSDTWRNYCSKWLEWFIGPYQKSNTTHTCVRDATSTKTKQSCLGNQDEGNFSCGTGWKVEVKKNFCFLLKNEWWFPSLIFLLDIAEELEGPASLQIRPWSPFNQKTMELIVFDQRRRFTNFYLNLKTFCKAKKKLL